MSTKLKSFLLVLIPFTLLFFGIQFYIVSLVKEQEGTFFYNTWSIYVFHFFVTLIIYMLVLFVNKILPDKTGFVFMGSSLLKMMAAFVFLLPLIQVKEQYGINDVFAFFIPYFLFLFLETFYVLKIINQK
ncbi:DUF6168 family protein [Cellulophaga fucicola]|uniref:ATP synthase protein I n=1 Tax=Cellulophaga fucicola TaxID=76595 RepID=A0A1K1QB88_9FLAO|nr:DUF6168 family protein [Cellulophaga fucicola]SFW56915.1 hypothetical protein SAMN05660313_02530 [Cellulophaga fucicola]